MKLVSCSSASQLKGWAGSATPPTTHPNVMARGRRRGRQGAEPIHPPFHCSCRNGSGQRPRSMLDMGIERRLPKEPRPKYTPFCAGFSGMSISPPSCNGETSLTTRNRGVGEDIPNWTNPGLCGKIGAPPTRVPPCREQGWSPTPPAFNRPEATTSQISRPRAMGRTHEIDWTSTKIGCTWVRIFNCQWKATMSSGRSSQRSRVTY